jgi:hypothetical protein
MGFFAMLTVHGQDRRSNLEPSATFKKAGRPNSTNSIRAQRCAGGYLDFDRNSSITSPEPRLLPDALETSSGSPPRRRTVGINLVSLASKGTRWGLLVCNCPD